MNKDRIQIYLKDRFERLRRLEAMWSDPRVQLYHDTQIPEDGGNGVFLAGPTSRSQILEYNWRCEAVSFLRQLEYKGWIFCPEPRGQENEGDFTERKVIHKWESDRLMLASDVVFWIPRNKDELLGLNTNLELGIILGMRMGYSSPRRVHVGWPDDAERMGLPRHYVHFAELRCYNTLWDTCREVVSK